MLSPTLSDAELTSLSENKARVLCFDAIRIGDDELLERILDRCGPSPLLSTDSRSGYAPIHACVQVNSIDCLSVIVHAIDVENELKGKNVLPGINVQHLLSGDTALHIAARSGNINAIDMLFDANIDPSIRNKRGQYAAEVAEEVGFDELAEALWSVISPDGTSEKTSFDDEVANINLHPAAVVTVTESRSPQNGVIRTRSHMREIPLPLSVASTSDDEEFESVDSRSALQSPLENQSRLSRADLRSSRSGHVQSVDAHHQVVKEPRSPSSPLDDGNDDSYRIMESQRRLRGLPVGGPTRKGATLIDAVESNDLKMTEFHLSLNADLNIIRPQDGATPLLLAIARKNLSLVTRLLEAGANPLLSPIASGTTPLLLACELGESNIARVIIEYGGRDAVEFAVRNDPELYSPSNIPVDRMQVEGSDSESDDVSSSSSSSTRFNWHREWRSLRARPWLVVGSVSDSDRDEDSPSRGRRPTSAVSESASSIRSDVESPQPPDPEDEPLPLPYLCPSIAAVLRDDVALLRILVETGADIFSSGDQLYAEMKKRKASSRISSSGFEIDGEGADRPIDDVESVASDDPGSRSTPSSPPPSFVTRSDTYHSMSFFEWTSIHVASFLGFWKSLQYLLHCADTVFRTLFEETGSAQEVLEMFPYSPDVRTRDDQLTPLHLAARGGHGKAADVLVSFGADLLAKTSDGLDVAYIAASFKHHSLAQRLRSMIESQKILSAPVTNDSTELRSSSPVVRTEFPNDIRLRVNLSPSEIQQMCILGKSIDERDAKGRTLLMYASYQNFLPQIVAALENGSDVNAVDYSGMSALFFASLCGHADTVDLLLQSGASPFLLSVSGSSALFVASQKGYHEICEMILERAEDVEKKRRKRTGESVSASGNEPGSTKRLGVESAGRPVSASSVSSSRSGFSGVSELNALSSEGGHDGPFSVVELVNSRIVNVDEFGDDLGNGATPLFSASAAGHYEVIRVLIRYGADVFVRCPDNAFPLLVAAQNGHYDVCKFLVRRHSIAGVTVDWKTDMGVTPLFAASRQGFQEITELLISYGANPWLKTNDGLSVLDAVQTRIDEVRTMKKSAIESEKRSREQQREIERKRREEDGESDDGWSTDGDSDLEEALREAEAPEPGTSLLLQFLREARKRDPRREEHLQFDPGSQLPFSSEKDSASVVSSKSDSQLLYPSVSALKGTSSSASSVPVSSSKAKLQKSGIASGSSLSRSTSKKSSTSSSVSVVDVTCDTVLQLVSDEMISHIVLHFAEQKASRLVLSLFASTGVVSGSSVDARPAYSTSSGEALRRNSPSRSSSPLSSDRSALMASSNLPSESDGQVLTEARRRILEIRRHQEERSRQFDETYRSSLDLVREFERSQKSPLRTISAASSTDPYTDIRATTLARRDTSNEANVYRNTNVDADFSFRSSGVAAAATSPSFKAESRVDFSWEDLLSPRSRTFGMESLHVSEMPVDNSNILQPTSAEEKASSRRETHLESTILPSISADYEPSPSREIFVSADSPFFSPLPTNSLPKVEFVPQDPDATFDATVFATESVSDLIQEPGQEEKSLMSLDTFSLAENTFALPEVETDALEVESFCVEDTSVSVESCFDSDDQNASASTNLMEAIIEFNVYHLFLDGSLYSQRKDIPLTDSPPAASPPFVLDFDTAVTSIRTLDSSLSIVEDVLEAVEIGYEVTLSSHVEFSCSPVEIEANPLMSVCSVMEDVLDACLLPYENSVVLVVDFSSPPGIHSMDSGMGAVEEVLLHYSVPYDVSLDSLSDDFEEPFIGAPTVDFFPHAIDSARNALESILEYSLDVGNAFEARSDSLNDLKDDSQGAASVDVTASVDHLNGEIPSSQSVEMDEVLSQASWNSDEEKSSSAKSAELFSIQLSCGFLIDVVIDPSFGMGQHHDDAIETLDTYPWIRVGVFARVSSDFPSLSRHIGDALESVSAVSSVAQVDEVGFEAERCSLIPLDAVYIDDAQLAPTASPLDLMYPPIPSFSEVQEYLCSFRPISPAPVFILDDRWNPPPPLPKPSLSNVESCDWVVDQMDTNISSFLVSTGDHESEEHRQSPGDVSMEDSEQTSISLCDEVEEDKVDLSAIDENLPLSCETLESVESPSQDKESVPSDGGFDSNFHASVDTDTETGADLKVFADHVISDSSSLCASVNENISSLLRGDIVLDDDTRLSELQEEPISQSSDALALNNLDSTDLKLSCLPIAVSLPDDSPSNIAICPNSALSHLPASMTTFGFTDSPSEPYVPPKTSEMGTDTSDLGIRKGRRPGVWIIDASVQTNSDELGWVDPFLDDTAPAKLSIQEASLLPAQTPRQVTIIASPRSFASSTTRSDSTLGLKRGDVFLQEQFDEEDEDEYDFSLDTDMDTPRSGRGQSIPPMRPPPLPVADIRLNLNLLSSRYSSIPENSAYSSRSFSTQSPKRNESCDARMMTQDGSPIQRAFRSTTPSEDSSRTLSPRQSASRNSVRSTGSAKSYESYRMNHDVFSVPPFESDVDSRNDGTLSRLIGAISHSRDENANAYQSYYDYFYQYFYDHYLQQQQRALGLNSPTFSSATNFPPRPGSLSPRRVIAEMSAPRNMAYEGPMSARLASVLDSHVSREDLLRDWNFQKDEDFEVNRDGLFADGEGAKGSIVDDHNGFYDGVSSSTRIDSRQQRRLRRSRSSSPTFPETRTQSIVDAAEAAEEDALSKVRRLLADVDNAVQSLSARSAMRSPFSERDERCSSEISCSRSYRSSSSSLSEGTPSQEVLLSSVETILRQSKRDIGLDVDTVPSSVHFSTDMSAVHAAATVSARERNTSLTEEEMNASRLSIPLDSSLVMKSVDLLTFPDGDFDQGRRSDELLSSTLGSIPPWIEFPSSDSIRQPSFHRIPSMQLSHSENFSHPSIAHASLKESRNDDQVQSGNIDLLQALDSGGSNVLLTPPQASTSPVESIRSLNRSPTSPLLLSSLRNSPLSLLRSHSIPGGQVLLRPRSPLSAGCISGSHTPSAPSRCESPYLAVGDKLARPDFDGPESDSQLIHDPSAPSKVQTFEALLSAKSMMDLILFGALSMIGHSHENTHFSASFGDTNVLCESERMRESEASNASVQDTKLESFASLDIHSRNDFVGLDGEMILNESTREVISPRPISGSSSSFHPPLSPRRAWATPRPYSAELYKNVHRLRYPLGAIDIHAQDDEEEEDVEDDHGETENDSHDLLPLHSKSLLLNRRHRVDANPHRTSGNIQVDSRDGNVVTLSSMSGSDSLSLLGSQSSRPTSAISSSTNGFTNRLRDAREAVLRVATLDDAEENSMHPVDRTAWRNTARELQSILTNLSDTSFDSEHMGSLRDRTHDQVLDPAVLRQLYKLYQTASHSRTLKKKRVEELEKAAAELAALHRVVDPTFLSVPSTEEKKLSPVVEQNSPRPPSKKSSPQLDPPRRRRSHMGNGRSETSNPRSVVLEEVPSMSSLASAASVYGMNQMKRPKKKRNSDRKDDLLRRDIFDSPYLEEAEDPAVRRAASVIRMHALARRQYIESLNDVPSNFDLNVDIRRGNMESSTSFFPRIPTATSSRSSSSGGNDRVPSIHLSDVAVDHALQTSKKRSDTASFQLPLGGRSSLRAMPRAGAYRMSSTPNRSTSTPRISAALPSPPVASSRRLVVRSPRNRK